uniref:Uncharacterized protein n=1 Tax=Geospiza parvula TaxID=87175 RepID=A0A8U8CAI5_GEOPR
VGEAQVQNLVIMLLQGLHLHTRDGVVEPLELIEPRGPERTWVPRHVPGHAVVAVEKLLPQEFVAGHGAPLLADEPHREHVGVVQVQKDLEQDGVREPGAARVHRVILPPRLEPSALRPLTAAHGGPAHPPAPRAASYGEGAEGGAETAAAPSPECARKSGGSGGAQPPAGEGLG